MAVYVLFLILIFCILILDKIIRPYLYSTRNTIDENSYARQYYIKSESNISIAVMAMILFTIFRSNVGWDYLAYYNSIKYGIITNIVSNGEYGTIMLIRVSKYLNNPNIFFIVNGFISLLLISKAIKRYSKDQWSSLFWFLCFPLFFLNSLSVVRLFTALSLTFYGFRYIEQKKAIKYAIVVFVASLFHKSALIAILLYFISTVKLKVSRLIILLFLLPVIGVFLNFLVLNYLPRYAIYTEKTNIQEGTKAIIVFVIITILSVTLKDRIIKDDPIASAYLNCFLFGISIYLMFYNQGTMGHRLSLYGTIFSVLLIPKLVSIIKNPTERVIVNIIIYTLCYVMFLYTVYVGADTYIPYATILSE